MLLQSYIIIAFSWLFFMDEAIFTTTSMKFGANTLDLLRGVFKCGTASEMLI